MINTLLITLLITMMISGGLSDVSAATTGILICGLILFWKKYRLKTFEKISVKEAGLFAFPVIILLCLLTSLWSVDYSCNLLGCMRLIILCFWGILICQLSLEQKGQLLRALPYLGLAGSLVSYPLGMVIAGRLSGPFYYANTWGMFLALCIMIGCFGMEDGTMKKWDYSVLALNVLCFIFTGSRSAFLVLACWGIYKLITSKRLRPVLLAGFGCILAAAAVSYFLLGNTQTVGRIFTLTKAGTSQTVFERLLYWKDGLSCLRMHPFGLGYLGYNYLQGSFQTGSYETLFVHSDLLQFAIDYGVIPAVLLALYFGYQFVCGKQERSRKELLAVLLAGSMVDIHLQYLFMGMVMVLLLQLPKLVDVTDAVKKSAKGKKKSHPETGRAGTALLIYTVVSGLILLYMLIPFAAENLAKDADTALRFCGEYSAAQDSRLERMDDYETINALTERILAKNKSNPEAWTAKVVLTELLGDTEGMCEAMRHSMELSRFDQELSAEFESSVDEQLAGCTDEAQRALLLEQKQWLIDQRKGLNQSIK